MRDLVLTLLFGVALAEEFPSRNDPRSYSDRGIDDNSIERSNIFSNFNFQEDSREFNTQGGFSNRGRFQGFQDKDDSGLTFGLSTRYSSPQNSRPAPQDGSFEFSSNTHFNRQRPAFASGRDFPSQNSGEFGLGGVRAPQRTYGTPSQSLSARGSNDFRVNEARSTSQGSYGSSVGPSISSSNSAEFGIGGIGGSQQRFFGTPSRPQSFHNSGESQVRGTSGLTQGRYGENSRTRTPQGSFGLGVGRVVAESQSRSFGQLGGTSISSLGSSQFGSGTSQNPPRTYGAPSRSQALTDSDEIVNGRVSGFSHNSNVIPARTGNTFQGSLGFGSGGVRGSQQRSFGSQGRYGASSQDSGELGIGGQRNSPQTSYRQSGGSFGSQSTPGRNQNHQRLTQQGNLGQNNDGRYGVQQQSCGEGLELGLNGECVEPEVERNLFIYEEPQKESREIDVPLNLPRPKLKYNVVVINSADDKNEEPIIIPPPREKTVVLVLNENNGDQKIIEVPKRPTSDPEVFFVEYKDGENPLLPGGIDLQTALQATQTQDGQQGGNTYEVPQNQNNQGRIPLNNLGGQGRFTSVQQNNQQQQRYSPQNNQFPRARNLNFNQGDRSNEQFSSGISSVQLNQPQNTYSIPSEGLGNQNTFNSNNQLPQNTYSAPSQTRFQGNQNNRRTQIQLGQNAYSSQTEGNSGISSGAQGSVVVKGTLSKLIRGDENPLEFDGNFPAGPRPQLNNQINGVSGQGQQISRPEQQYIY